MDIEELRKRFTETDHGFYFKLTVEEYVKLRMSLSHQAWLDVGWLVRTPTNGDIEYGLAVIAPCL